MALWDCSDSGYNLYLGSLSCPTKDIGFGMCWTSLVCTPLFVALIDKQQQNDHIGVHFLKRHLSGYHVNPLFPNSLSGLARGRHCAKAILDPHHLLTVASVKVLHLLRMHVSQRWGTRLDGFE